MASAFGVIQNNLNNLYNLASAFGRRKILRLYSTHKIAGSSPHPMASAQQEREDNEDKKYYAMQIVPCGANANLQLGEAKFALNKKVCGCLRFFRKISCFWCSVRGGFWR